MMSEFTFVDLFAGIGGFHIAAESLGGKSVGFSEIAKDAIAAYCENFNESPENNLGDITKLKTLPPHDFMTAGVPCQSWSIAGKKLGFDDDRGQLWNDTIYLLNKVRPKAFLFENVKGLADPRNEQALNYILSRISEAGYFAKTFILNAFDYGVPQMRIRMYIVGFENKEFLNRLSVDRPQPGKIRLCDVLDHRVAVPGNPRIINKPRWSLSCNEQGFNDYFLLNDLRSGSTTIHSWDIQETSAREKKICEILLRNRRKGIYGILDGNALSLKQFQSLDASIGEEELEGLVEMGILKHYPYFYDICGDVSHLDNNESFLLSFNRANRIMVDELKKVKELRRRKVDILNTLKRLESNGVVKCTEMRYDFKNGKISTGLDGVNRIFLPSSQIYPTLVASDTNDYIATEVIYAENIDDWKKNFMEQIYKPKKFRKITKSEACRIQGFPDNFKLPESRAKWMHLIGNSVAVPVVKMLTKSIIRTGVFNAADWDGRIPAASEKNIGALKKRREAQLVFDF